MKKLSKCPNSHIWNCPTISNIISHYFKCWKWL